MKTILLGIAAWGAAAVLALGAPEEQEEVETGLREAYKLYQEEKLGEVSAKLREVLAILEQKETAKVGGILPGMLEDWESDELKREDLSLLGGGFSIQRNYFWGVKKANIKLVKDSPLLETVMKLLQNDASRR